MTFIPITGEPEHRLPFDRGVLRRNFLLVLLCASLGGAKLTAQRVAVGDPLEDYARIVSTLDSLPNPSFAVRPLADSVWASVLRRGGHPWAARLKEESSSWSLTPLSFRATGNSALPSGGNDGLMWQGKGMNAILDAGATWRGGHFEATLRSQYTVSSNGAFPLAPVADSGLSDFANPWHPYGGKTGKLGYLDLPQRMGGSTYSKIGLGGSFLRVREGGWAAGVSEEGLWWGPAQRNPLIFSNNAPAVRHAFIGTVRPVDLPGARFEARWIWGSLKNSGFSDSIPDDSTRYVTGLVAALHPDFLPGLSLGGSRTFYMMTPEGGLEMGDLFLVFQALRKKELIDDPSESAEDVRDQMLTLFGRYAPPGSGFEVYFEWGRNDHSWDWRDLLMEPEHAAVSTIGAQKALRIGSDKILRIAGEWTDLERGLTQLVRPTPSWYAHYIVSDGWTNEGQYLGAPIGTGSRAQTLWSDLFTKWGRVGVLVGRVARDNDALYQILADSIYQDFRSHQVEVTLQSSALVYWKGLEIDGVFTWEKTFNRNMQYLNDVTNLHFELGVRSRFPRWP